MKYSKRLLALLLPMGLVALSTSSSAMQVTTTVAVLRLDKPSVPTFTLHGTIPVPPGTFMGTETVLPFWVVDRTGAAVPTQLEVVAWHPDPADGASVVEVIAQMTTPTTAATTLQFNVVTNPATVIPRKVLPANPTALDVLLGPDNLHSDITNLLVAPNQLLLVATDPNDKLYYVDLAHEVEYTQGAMEVKRYGKVQSEVRNHKLMRPWPGQVDTPADPLLDHMFGVHSYLRFSSGDPVLELDLRLHNAANSQPGTTSAMTTVLNEPHNDMYFKNLALLVPSDYGIVQDITDTASGGQYVLGAYRVFPLVTEFSLEPGEVHFMPSQGQFERRISIAKLTEAARAYSHADGEGIAFATKGPGGAKDPNLLWSWWNEATAFYLPQRQLLPRLTNALPTFEADLASEYATMKGHVTSGMPSASAPYQSGALGWAYPYDGSGGGGTSGNGIVFTSGLRTLLTASLDGYRRLELKHRMVTDRTANALYRWDGEASSLEDWVQVSGTTTYLPFNFYSLAENDPSDPFGFEGAPVNPLWGHSAPSYQAALDGYEHFDTQHMIRSTGPMKALVWIGNDSLAKDDLQMQAELAQMGYHPYDKGPSGAVQGTTMKGDLVEVALRPNTGVAFGRREGWILDAMVSAYATSSDPLFRARKLTWVQDIITMLDSAKIFKNSAPTVTTGVFHAEKSKYFPKVGGVHIYRGRTITQVSIVENALVGADRSVLASTDPVKATAFSLIVDSLKALVYLDSWPSANAMPFRGIATGPFDKTTGPANFLWNSIPTNGLAINPTTGLTHFDDHHQWASLAYGHTYSDGFADFMGRATNMYVAKWGGDAATLEHMLYVTDPDGKDGNWLGNICALFALVEYDYNFH